MEIFKLFGSIFVDNEKANESISKTGDKAESLASKVGKGLKTVAGIGAAVGGAVAAGGAALIGVVGKANEAASAIDKFAKQANISTDEYQKLDVVMKNSGWSMEQAAGDFSALSEKIMESTEGSGEAYEMFEKLGVSTTNLDGSLRNTGDVFNDTIMALQNVTNETERSAIASILLGTTGEELATTLNMTNEEFKAMKENANIIDSEQIAQAQEFKEGWNQIKTTFTNVVTEIGVSLMPIFNSLFEWVNANMPTIKSIIEKAFEVISNVVSGAVSIIEWLIDAFGKLFESSNITSDGLNETWNKVKDMFSEVFVNIVELLQAFIQTFQQFWEEWGDTITLWISTAWGNIEVIFDTAFKTINNLLKIFTSLFKGDWTGLWEGIKQFVSDIWEGIKQLTSNSLDGLIQILRNIIPNMIQAGKDMINGVWDGMKSIWNSISNWVSDKVSWLTDKLMFWRKSESEMSSSSSNSRSVDGSHRNGLDYVPYDGYVAELHKGERVLTAEENKLRGTDKQPINNITFVINSPTGNPKEISREIQKDLSKYNRALGVV